MFVLIVGARYGYVPPGTDRSIVNLEYIAAREAGIPIYVFILDQGRLRRPECTTARESRARNTCRHCTGFRAGPRFHTGAHRTRG